MNVETFKTIKYWDCIHDLPVTCLAARPHANTHTSQISAVEMAHQEAAAELEVLERRELAATSAERFGKIVGAIGQSTLQVAPLAALLPRVR